MVEGRKIIVKIIFRLFLNFVSSKVHRLVLTRVSGACVCCIWVIFLFVKNFYGQIIFFRTANSNYLALINRAGGLYGRILTEVVSEVCTHDRGQDSPIQTD